MPWRMVIMRAAKPNRPNPKPKPRWRWGSKRRWAASGSGAENDSDESSESWVDRWYGRSDVQAAHALWYQQRNHPMEGDDEEGAHQKGSDLRIAAHFDGENQEGKVVQVKVKKDCVCEINPTGQIVIITESEQQILQVRINACDDHDETIEKMVGIAKNICAGFVQKADLEEARDTTFF